MSRRTGTALLTMGVLALGACSAADATADTTPAVPAAPVTTSTSVVAATTTATAPTVTPFRPTHAVDPGMVLSGHDVVTAAEVRGATEAAANG